MVKVVSNPIRLRKNITIGAPDAESDRRFLKECFIDTGDLSVLRSCTDSKCIVLGRTGSGKTALLDQLREVEDHSTELLPETLALNHIANSGIIQFFESAGVRLDLFYKLLWNHLISVELLRMRYDVTTESQKKEMLSKLLDLFGRNEAKKRALAYLEQWGNRFWESTELRVKEFTTKLEDQLKGSASLGNKIASFNAEAASKLTKEEKREIVTRANDIVNQVQIRELAEIISLFAEHIFSDPQKRYFITIDRLDEGWAEDRLRYKLIKALIEAIRSFRKVQNIKIIVALRTDLYQRVLHETVGAGFQEEKYKSLYLDLTWTRDNLKRLINRRVNILFKRQYSNDGISIEDILPKNQKEKMTALDYIIDRTFYRPREAIIFVNECITQSEGQTRISAQGLRDAESVYSRERLQSLAEEWIDEHPCLNPSSKILVGKNFHFRLADIDHDMLQSFMIKLLEEHGAETDRIIEISEQCFLEETRSEELFLGELFSIFYKVGLVGIKTDGYTSMRWAFKGEPFTEPQMITAGALVEVHPTFHSSLNITKRIR